MMNKTKNGQRNVATSAYSIEETIGELIKNKADDEGWICLNSYSGDYLNEEDRVLFGILTGCTDGFNITGEFDEDGDVIVFGYEHSYYTCYDYDYPVIDVYKELIEQMQTSIEALMKEVKEKYIQHFDDYKRLMTENEYFRMWTTEDMSIHNALIYFADDYGIEIKDGFDFHRGSFIDIIGIKE